MTPEVQTAIQLEVAKQLAQTDKDKAFIDTFWGRIAVTVLAALLTAYATRAILQGAK